MHVRNANTPGLAWTACGGTGGTGGMAVATERGGGGGGGGGGETAAAASAGGEGEALVATAEETKVKSKNCSFTLMNYKMHVFAPICF